MWQANLLLELTKLLQHCNANTIINPWHTVPPQVIKKESYTPALWNSFSLISLSLHTHREIVPLNRMRHSWRNITSEECDRDCPFCPRVVRGGISGAESCVRDDTSSARKTNPTDYRSEERERTESWASLNAGRCHFVWPLWELPLCMTQSMSACHWDSLRVSAAVSPSFFLLKTSCPNTFCCLLPSNWPDHGQ